MTYKTLAEMFADDVSTPKAKEYVSPDGSVFLPAGHVFQQGRPTPQAGGSPTISTPTVSSVLFS